MSPLRDTLRLDRYHTGIAVPLSALRSHFSTGVGEFLDLPALASWCNDIGLSVIQLLPVNDTGTLSSPYSAVSAFALHPIYLRLQEVAACRKCLADIDAYRREAEVKDRLAFNDVLTFKMVTLENVFEPETTLTPEIRSWIEQNDWVKPYAVYKCLKENFDEKSWLDWPEYRDPSAEDVSNLWEEFRDRALFFAWIQYELAGQLTRAAREVETQRVFLKGDIPILMNVDSADVWLNRDVFNLDFRAGVPPDMYTELGQFWGFPTYDWEAAKANDFSWWRARLKAAADYYHAFRIDHVLGFFRIWSIPAKEGSAILGRYRPAQFIEDEALSAAGFDSVTLEQLTRAWTTRDDGADSLDVETDRILDTYFEHDGGDRYFLNEEVAGELLIQDLSEPEHIKDFLVECHRDRTLVSSNGEGWAPAWYATDSSGYESLTEAARGALEDLIDAHEEESEPLWTTSGRRLLKMVVETTDMLACAEDLGQVPKGVPEVLKELNILCLKLERWELDENEKIVSPETFPFLCVSTPSIHDSSTLRGWWEEEWDHERLFEALGLEGEVPEYLTKEVAEAFIKRSLSSASALVMFQFQDLFSLTYSLRSQYPDDERINVPGTVNDGNWTYRLPITLETLRNDRAYTRKLRDLISERSKRKLRSSNG